MPDIASLLADLAATLGGWTYLLVAGLAFLETGAFVGLIAPGETAVVLGGVVAAQGEISLVAILLTAWVASLAGDVASFALGRRLGRPFLHRHGPRMKLSSARIERVEGFYDRHGGKAILVGRFVGIIRAVSPFIAGASGLRMRAFLPYSVIGTAAWASAFTLAGYLFHRSFEQAAGTAQPRRPRAGRAGRGRCRYRTPIRSTTNTSVSSGPMTPPAPRLP